MQNLTLDQAKRYFLADNRGVLKRVSEDTGAGYSFVAQIFWARNRSRSGEVERKLAAAGAPGFEQFKSAAATAAE